MKQTPGKVAVVEIFPQPPLIHYKATTTPVDHRVLKALLDGLAMCYTVETDKYPYEETLYEKYAREERERKQQENKP